MLTTLLVGRLNSTLRIPLITIIMLGYWAPSHYQGFRKILFSLYNFLSYLIIVGVLLVVQVGDLYQAWGNVSLMTASLFMLFTNLVFNGKLINIILREERIKNMIEEINAELVAESRERGIEIITRSDRETTVQLYGYLGLTHLTLFGLAASAEERQLLIRAWYPYDVTKSPAFEITYAYQFLTLFFASTLHICVDTLTFTLIRQCRCRLQLVALSLTTLCDDPINDEEIMINRLRECIRRHQAALRQAHQLQEYFSYPIFGQLSVSLFIICATAYQLAFESSNIVRILTINGYLVDMSLQVFFYCYHGNQLLDESENIREAAFQCPWYECTVRVQRMLSIIITRTYRVARLRAGGVIELSLVSFMKLIKTSYTLFTVLQQFAE